MKEEKEIWKDIKGYEGLYQVSNMGNVKSLERTVRNSRGYRIVAERILKPQSNSKGYLYVNLYKDGKMKRCRVNRLVAQAFLPNPHNLPVINHKDENKQNNYVENLEWCSHSYNNSYNGRAKKIGEKNTNNPKISKPVFSVNKVSGLIVEFPSLIEAERQTGISNSSICKCLKGKRNSAGGCVWFYADDDTK